MHWPTHLLIADIVNRMIGDKLQGTLNRGALRFGSIKPDMTPRLLKIKHLKHRSLNEVSKMIEDIKSKNLPSEGKKLKKYSIELGIIMHYMTDFFCYAHIHPKYVNKLEHIKYEWLVAFEYARVNVDEVLVKAMKNFKHLRLIEEFSIADYIDKRHNEYLSKSNSVKNDVSFSLEMCMTIALFIVGESMAAQMFKAA